jgi:hypothetical protein
VRVYIPATSTVLRALIDQGSLSEVPITAFAVTPGLREWYVDDDIEELEYAASAEAARGSLRLLSDDPAAARRRVVLAADVPDDVVAVRDDLDRGVVRLSDPVPLAQIASVHVDDVEAEADMRRAAAVIDRADLGDPEAEEAVDDAEGHELMWFATQEISMVLVDMGRDTV